MTDTDKSQNSEDQSVAETSNRSMYKRIKDIIRSNAMAIYSVVFLFLTWVVIQSPLGILTTDDPTVLHNTVQKALLEEGDVYKQQEKIASLSTGQPLRLSKMFGIYHLDVSLNTGLGPRDGVSVFSDDDFSMIVTDGITFFMTSGNSNRVSGPFSAPYPMNEALSGYTSPKLFGATDTNFNRCIFAVEFDGTITTYYFPEIQGFSPIYFDMKRQRVVYGDDELHNFRTATMDIRPVTNPKFDVMDLGGAYMNMFHRIVDNELYLVGEKDNKLVLLTTAGTTINSLRQFPAGPADPDNFPYFVPAGRGVIVNSKYFNISESRQATLPGSENENFYSMRGITFADHKLALYKRDNSKIFLRTFDISKEPVTSKDIKTPIDFRTELFSVKDDLYIKSPSNIDSPNGRRTYDIMKVTDNSLSPVTIPFMDRFVSTQFISNNNNFSYVGTNNSALPSFFVTAAANSDGKAQQQMTLLQTNIPVNTFIIKITSNPVVILVLAAFVISAYILGFNIIKELTSEVHVARSAIYENLPSLRDKMHNVEATLNNLKMRYDTMLYLGIAIGIFGIGAFLIMVEHYSGSFTGPFKDHWFEVIRPVSLLLFVETLSFFFLRQYRIIFQEYKVFYAVYLKIQNYFHVLEIRMHHGEGLDLAPLAKQLIEENFALATVDGDTQSTLVYQEIVKKLIDKLG